MEANVPFAVVDEDASFHAKFSDLAQDAGTGALRSLVYMHAMERKYDALEKQLHEAMKDVEKHKHQATTFEERMEGLFLDKDKAEKVISNLEQEKASWATERGELIAKTGELEKDLPILRQWWRIARWRWSASSRTVLIGPSLKWHSCIQTWICPHWTR